MGGISGNREGKESSSLWEHLSFTWRLPMVMEAKTILKILRYSLRMYGLLFEKWQDVNKVLNEYYHNMLDCIVLNVSLYSIGSHGAQQCKSTMCPCVCVRSCQPWISSNSIYHYLQNMKGGAGNEVELPWDGKEYIKQNSFNYEAHLYVKLRYLEIHV